MYELNADEYKIFENIKHIREDGSEYWSARELGPTLEYTKWDNFHKVIKKAMISCENAGRSILDQFPEVRNLVNGGVAPRTKVDYELSRYACYLIVQNGDPRKEVIALGQTYFALYLRFVYIDISVKIYSILRFIGYNILRILLRLSWNL